MAVFTFHAVQKEAEKFSVGMKPACKETTEEGERGFLGLQGSLEPVSS